MVLTQMITINIRNIIIEFKKAQNICDELVIWLIFFNKQRIFRHILIP